MIGDGVHRSALLTRVVALLTATFSLVFPVAAVAEEAELILPVTINEVVQGETPVTLIGEDIYIPLRTLERAGLTGALWQRVQLVAGVRAAERLIQGEPAVSLKSLEPWASFSFDEANLTLSVTVSPELMQRHALTVSTSRPPDIVYPRDFGGFFNYALQTTGGVRPSGFGELAATTRNALIYTGFSDTPGEGLVRGLTNMTFDQRQLLRRWTAGDAPVFSDELGGTGVVGGLTVSRSFDLDPYFVRYPSLSLRGMATTPSQVEVYVNGVLVSRQTVQPGPFDVQNLPGTAGPTAAQVVVRDVFGREQSQSASFYYSTAVLGRGLSDYTYSAGYVRNNFSTDSFDYETPLVLASGRRGFTDNLTAGGRVEATDDLVSIGSSLAFASRLGELDLNLAGSSTRGVTGSAAQIGLRRLSRRASLSGSVRMFSRDYVNFSLPRTLDRPLTEVEAGVALLPRWGNLGLQISTAQMRDGGNRNRLSLLTNVPLSDRVDLLVSAAASDTDAERLEMEYFAGVSVHLWQGITANIGASRTLGKNVLLAEVQRPLPVGDGWGYRVQTTTGASETDGGAAVQYQNRFGRFELIAPLRHGNVTANLAGGLVYQGGNLMLTRPVAQSFALVRVPGVPNVRVYLSNQLVGRTDARGDLLVPNMLSYYGNRLSIDDRDIPMNYDVQVVEQTIGPPHRGGAVVEFPVRAIRTATGSALVQITGGEPVIPAYGQMTFTRDKEVQISPLGGTGDFYFENLTPGIYQALIEYDAGSCTFAVTIPDSSGEVIELGQLVCTEKAKS